VGFFPLWYPDDCSQPDSELALCLLKPVQVWLWRAVINLQARDGCGSYPETRSLQNLAVDEYVTLGNTLLD